jgi:GcrA cell cycle regulator
MKGSISDAVPTLASGLAAASPPRCPACSTGPAFTSLYRIASKIRLSIQVEAAHFTGYSMDIVSAKLNVCQTTAPPGRTGIATSCGVSMEWTIERVELLKELWGEGLSARQIAELLGHVTRNAVIGKAHRLGLSTRSVPSKPTIAMLNPVTDRMCQWPIGNPGEVNFHFCGHQASASRPYCDQHCAMAYRNTGDSSSSQSNNNVRRLSQRP